MCRYMAASIQDWPKLIANIYEYVTLSPFPPTCPIFILMTPSTATSIQEAGPSSKI